MLKKIGDKVVITNNTCYHHFRIGEDVVITDVIYVREKDYHFYNGKNAYGDQWSFRNEDIA